MKHIDTIKYRSFFSLAFALIFLAACEGPIGPPGPPGFDGLDGRDGNANVISINYEIFAEDWIDIGTLGDPGFFRVIDLGVPEVSPDIVDNGVVLAYYRAQDTDPWIALPFTFISHDPEYVEVFDFVYQDELVTLQSSATDREGTAYAGVVRLVIAEAVPVLKRSIDYKNYQEVAEIFGLEESAVIQRKAKILAEQD